MVNAGFTYGIDLGGTNTRVGLFDQYMRLRGSRAMATPVTAGPAIAVRAMAEAIAALSVESHAAREVGIGIGSPGPINLRDGILGILPNMPGWDGFPLRGALAEATGQAVVLESDANAAALAEWQMGAGKSLKLDSMAMVTLGTGVGSGLILNGRIWQGMFGMAGEIGHANIRPDGELCSCGTIGCLEMYASATAVVRAARRFAAHEQLAPAFADAVASRALSAEQVAKLAQSGDPLALRIFTDLGCSLGIGLANLVNTLDLPLIVIGGGLAEAWHLFSEAMFRTINEYSVVYRLLAPLRTDTYQPNKTHICKAGLGPDAGLIGAAMLPRLVPHEAPNLERRELQACTSHVS